jgi:LemA protein
MIKRIYQLVLLALVSTLFSSCGYNSMVDKREEVDKTWANIQSQYQRRSDLIPRLAKVVKSYADFEQETLTKVVEAREKATSINFTADQLTEENMNKFRAAQSAVSSGLSRLLAVVENYPDLKANQNYLDLQRELTGTENRIAVARNNYNDAVKGYNAYIKKIPRVIYAGWFGFKEKPFYQADAGSEKAPSLEELDK